MKGSRVGQEGHEKMIREEILTISNLKKVHETEAIEYTCPTI